MQWKTPVKGGITGFAALMVGGIFAGFLPAIAPYSAIVGGAVTLYVLEMFIK